jgi:hypothetical protein
MWLLFVLGFAIWFVLAVCPEPITYREAPPSGHTFEQWCTEWKRRNAK